MLLFSDNSKGHRRKRFLSSRAQTSMEFVFTLALALLLLVPATVVFNRYATDSQQALLNTQIHKFGSEVIHLSEKMHASGVAWETLEVTIPGALTKVMIYSGPVSELVIQYDVGRVSEVVFFTPLKLTNQTGMDCSAGCVVDIKPGSAEIRVESHFDGSVVINPRD